MAGRLVGVVLKCTVVILQSIVITVIFCWIINIYYVCRNISFCSRIHFKIASPSSGFVFVFSFFLVHIYIFKDMEQGGEQSWLSCVKHHCYTLQLNIGRQQWKAIVPEDTLPQPSLFIAPDWGMLKESCLGEKDSSVCPFWDLGWGERIVYIHVRVLCL